MTTTRLRAATAALALTALVAGCAAPATEPAEPTEPPMSAPSTPSATATAAPTERAAAGGGVIDTTTWVEWVSSDGFTSLRHPADWDAASESVEPPEAFRDINPVLDSVELSAPNGQMLVGLWDYVDVGGMCDAESVRAIELLALEETDLPFDRAGAQAEIDEWFPGEDVEGRRPVLATYALGTVDGRWNVGVGLVEARRMQHETCYVYNIASTFGAGTAFEVTTAPDPLWTVDTLDDARAYMETAEYATILEILRSVEVA